MYSSCNLGVRGAPWIIAFQRSKSHSIEVLRGITTVVLYIYLKKKGPTRLERLGRPGGQPLPPQWNGIRRGSQQRSPRWLRRRRDADSAGRQSIASSSARFAHLDVAAVAAHDSVLGLPRTTDGSL